MGSINVLLLNWNLVLSTTPAPKNGGFYAFKGGFDTFIPRIIHDILKEFKSRNYD